MSDSDKSTPPESIPPERPHVSPPSYPLGELSDELKATGINFGPTEPLVVTSGIILRDLGDANADWLRHGPGAANTDPHAESSDAHTARAAQDALPPGTHRTLYPDADPANANWLGITEEEERLSNLGNPYYDNPGPSKPNPPKG